MPGEASPSIVELSAAAVKKQRDAATVAELTAEIDALGVELATVPAMQELVVDQPTVAALNNVAADAHVDAVTAAVDGDQTALETALQAHADALRALAASAPSSSDTSSDDPSQYRSVSRPATPGDPLIQSSPLPGVDNREPRTVAGVHPRVGGHLPTGYRPD
jgi:hypothetical protein